MISLHLKEQENTALRDGNDWDTSEAPLTLKYNGKGLDVNNIHYIIIALCKRNLLSYPRLLLTVMTGFGQVNWGFVPGMLELENSKKRGCYSCLSPKQRVSPFSWRLKQKIAFFSLNFPFSGAKVAHSPHPSQLGQLPQYSSKPQGWNCAGGSKWCCWWELLLSRQITWLFYYWGFNRFITEGLMGLLLWAGSIPKPFICVKQQIKCGWEC